MSELYDWSAGWLRRLIEQGGAHGPGTSRMITIGHWGDDVTDETFGYLFPDGVRTALDRLLEPMTGGRPRDDRAAVVHERPTGGSPALWIDAVQYRGGVLEERVVLYQAYRKRLLGRVEATGPLRPTANAGGSSVD